MTNKLPRALATLALLGALAGGGAALASAATSSSATTSTPSTTTPASSTVTTTPTTPTPPAGVHHCTGMGKTGTATGTYMPIGAGPSPNV
ncbi:MAG: hypothetical protein ACLP0J_16130 [Solirubrobacteraceae bacterium]